MYLDPGSGSIILQAILTAVLGIGVFLKLNWNRVKVFVTRSKSTDTDTKETSVERSED